MIDLAYYDRLEMDPRNIWQRVFASLFIWPNYALSGVKVVFEGLENVPTKAAGEHVILAPNHTDRYNYWPLQIKLWWEKNYPFTATWAKGKYYRNKWIGRFLNANQGIPLPSLMYYIEELYKKDHGKLPDRELYRELRDVVEGRRAADDPTLSDRARTIAGATMAGPDGSTMTYAEAVNAHFEAVMERVVRYTNEASERCGFNLIVFPEGTRSVRLGEGRTGLIQYALATGKRVVPIGCSGSDLVYPGNSPWAKRGTIVYRFGPAYDPRDLVTREDNLGPYTPFTAKAAPYRGVFERLTEDLMRRINGLVDARHQSDRYLPHVDQYLPPAERAGLLPE